MLGIISCIHVLHHRAKISLLFVTGVIFLATSCITRPLMHDPNRFEKAGDFKATGAIGITGLQGYAAVSPVKRFFISGNLQKFNDFLSLHSDFISGGAGLGYNQVFGKSHLAVSAGFRKGYYKWYESGSSYAESEKGDFMSWPVTAIYSKENKSGSLIWYTCLTVEPCRFDRVYDIGYYHPKRKEVIDRMPLLNASFGIDVKVYRPVYFATNLSLFTQSSETSAFPLLWQAGIKIRFSRSALKNGC